jgi:hypothetical protein
MNFEIDNTGCLTKYTGEDQHVEIPEGINTIGKYAFKERTRLAYLIIPEGVYCIGESAFEGCTRLKCAIIPACLTSIDDWAFEHCISLESVSLPESLKTIGRYCFWKCSSLTSVILPEGIETIGRYAFTDCENLRSVIIPKNVTSIGEGVFYNCSSLKSITIPANVTEISPDALCGCDKLAFIIIDNEDERAKICALLPDALHGKVITQAAYQHHLKEKEKIIVSVLFNYLLADDPQNAIRHTPNIFTTSVLPYLNQTDRLDGITDLLRFIFSFLSEDDIKGRVPGLAKVLDSIVFSDIDVPRMYPAGISDKANYTLSQNNYKQALQHAVTRYHCGYAQYCSRLLRQPGFFLSRRNMATWMYENRRTSATAQHAFDKQFGLM